MFKKTVVVVIACLFITAGLLVPSEACAEWYFVEVRNEFDQAVENVLIDFYFDEENSGTRLTDEEGIASFWYDGEFFVGPLWYATLWSKYIPIEPPTWFQDAPPNDHLINWIIENPE